MALGLRTAALNAATRFSRALGHVVWAVASWVRREPTPDGVKVQITLSYVQTGAKVGRRAAEMALDIFRRWTGAEARGGWLSITHAALEATWEALEGLLDLGMIDPPEVAPSVLVPAFRLDPLPERGKGKTRCGCPAHSHGDRDPSLLFDRGRGMATCMVSREVFVLQDDEEGTVACRVGRPVEVDGVEMASMLESEHTSTINKDTPSPGEHEGGRPPTTEGNGQTVEVHEEVPKVDRLILHPSVRDLDRAGRSGPDPRHPGITAGRLWPSGLVQSLSRAKDRTSWAKWQASRWGGDRGETIAWEELAYQERGGTPRAWMPERLVGIGWWRPSAVVWMEGNGGRKWPVLYLEEMGTGHVLFDVDGTEPLPWDPGKDLIGRVRDSLEGFGILDRVTWVIRTSTRGVQVLVKLRRFRWDPEGFYRDPAVQRFLRAAGNRVVEALGSGVLDPSAFAPRRFGRAPGWRVKGSWPEMARLWYTEG